MALIALIAAAPTEAGSPLATVALRAEAVVTGESVYLRDIARIEASDELLRSDLEALYVGRAALPGAARNFTLGTVLLRMRQARLPLDQIELVAEGQVARVSTSRVRLGPDAFLEAVSEWYQRLAPVPEGARLVLDVAAGEYDVPAGDVELRIASKKPEWGAFSLPVDIYHDQRLWRRVNVSVKAGVVQLAPVAARPLERGQVVGPADVAYVETELAKPLEPWLVPGEIRAIRFVAEGTAISERVVERVPDVERGASVRIAAKVGEVVVEITGIADQDGFFGQEMAVLNPASGARLFGNLAPDGVVWVKGL